MQRVTNLLWFFFLTPYWGEHFVWWMEEGICFFFLVCTLNKIFFFLQRFVVSLNKPEKIIYLENNIVWNYSGVTLWHLARKRLLYNIYGLMWRYKCTITFLYWLAVTDVHVSIGHRQQRTNHQWFFLHQAETSCRRIWTEDVLHGFFVLKKNVPQVLQTHNVSGLAFKVLISIHAGPPGL